MVRCLEAMLDMGEIVKTFINYLSSDRTASTELQDLSLVWVTAQLLGLWLRREWLTGQGTVKSDTRNHSNYAHDSRWVHFPQKSSRHSTGFAQTYFTTGSPRFAEIPDQWPEGSSPTVRPHLGLISTHVLVRS